VNNTGGKVAVGINDTGGKFAYGINDTGGEFATGVNNAGINDTGGKQWEQLSNCWQLKMNLKQIFYLFANSTTGTQRCPKEIEKKFLIKDFFHLPPVSVANLELWISPQIFEKIWNGLGETDSLKKPEAKNLMTLSLYTTSKDVQVLQNIL
jgi:hypothetical protein